MPENENEIVIPTHLKTNGRAILNVGDTITLNIGKRVSNGYELDQSNSFDKANSEEITNTKSKTYKIVGIIERPATNIEEYSAPGYTFITYMDDKDIADKANVYFRYTKEGEKEYIKVTANILGLNESLFERAMKSDFDSDEEAKKISAEMEKAKYNYDINDYLIALETQPLTNDAVGGLGTVVIIVCGIIVFTSIFCIKNSFDISIAEKTKQYGMLKSVGATKKQIRKNVFFEATILGLIGIPIGLLAGTVASWILIIVSNYFIGDMFASGLNLVLAFSWKAFAISIVLGIVTIYLSALRSARRASKISPIESIRNSGDIIIKSKKIKCPKIIKKIFGVGGEISYKNLKRNKKKYKTTVISITVSVFVFIALSYFMSMAFAEVKNELKLKDYNLQLSVHAIDNEQLYEKVKESTKLDNIKNYTISKSDRCYIKNPKYTSEYTKFIDENYGDNKDFYDGYIEVITVNNEQYKEYVKKLGINYENIKDKAIFITRNQLIGTYNVQTGKAEEKNLDVFDYKENDSLVCKIENDNQFEIKIGKITDAFPFGLNQQLNSAIVVSEELFDKYFDTNDVSVYYDSENPDKLQDDIDELLKDSSYSLQNIAENARMMNNLYILVGIFLYGFIIVIILIGITNIFNTITTSMELRKPEFAMLKSIGMTTKEFNKMIRLETVFMGVKSLIFSIPMGIVLSYMLYDAMESQSIKFQIPLNAIIISIVAVFLLITCIMKYAMNKINKQNTIETIRNENI